jgi:hypothetical protein
VSDEKEGISLKTVVGGILQGLREAKHIGDIESAKLFEEYKKNKVLSSFSVPAFTIADVDIELHFSIAGFPKEAGEGETSDIRVNITPASIKGLEPHQISIMKLTVSPVNMRVFEENRE